MPNEIPLSQFLRTRSKQLRQPAPLLIFYEITLPGGATPLRYVDFADPDARGTLPKKVPFNGVEFDSVDIRIGDIEEGQDGASSTIPLTVLDPLHQVGFFLRQNNWLQDQKLTLWLTAYDQLATPADALRETYVIVGGRLAQGPDTATILIGHVNLYEVRIPFLFYDRDRCFNLYSDRFVTGNACNYPSNELAEDTEQDLRAGGEYVEKERKHGWSTQMALKCSVFSVHLDSPGKLQVASSDPDLTWNGALRYGPYFYRELDGDFDVYTSIVVPATSRLLWLAGLCIQDLTAAAPIPVPGEPPPPIPTSSWLFWGAQQETVGGDRLLMRVTTADVSVDTTVAVSDKYLRVVRAGNNFTCYSRSSEAAAWAQRATTTLALPTGARIGVLLSSDAIEQLPVRADFDYIRFLAGGLSTCDYTKNGPAGCRIHRHVHHFNGFSEIPSDRARY